MQTRKKSRWRLYLEVIGVIAIAAVILLPLYSLATTGTVALPIVINLNNSQSNANSHSSTATVTVASTVTVTQVQQVPAPLQPSVNVSGWVKGNFISGVTFTPTSGGKPLKATFKNGNYWIMLDNKVTYDVKATWALSVLIGPSKCNPSTLDLQIGSDSVMPPFNLNC